MMDAVDEDHDEGRQPKLSGKCDAILSLNNSSSPWGATGVECHFLLYCSCRLESPSHPSGKPTVTDTHTGNVPLKDQSKLLEQMNYSPT